MRNFFANVVMTRATPAQTEGGVPFNWKRMNEDLFWQRVRKTPDCWLWTRGQRGKGYGAFAVNGKSIGAHRVAWQLVNGPIPKGLFVLHRCDNRLCVNPDHLFIGTQAENIADMCAKGRHRYGSDGAPPRIPEDVVSQIRDSSLSQRRLAQAFGISKTHVRSIKLGLRRKDRRETNCNGDNCGGLVT